MMATMIRSPLTVRSPSFHVSPAPSACSPGVHKQSSAKRTRSPEPSNEGLAQIAKRARAADSQPSAQLPTKEDTRKRKDREKFEKENEFRIKYSRAFPKFKFYFDLDEVNASLREELKARVAQMGSSVEYFFSTNITHLITDQPEESYTNKENTVTTKTSTLQSPIKLKGRALKDSPPENGADLVKTAVSLGLKIWCPSKLESVLDRCQVSIRPSALTQPTVLPSPVPTPAPSKERVLSRLLESERLHGTTERDPTQKRHDYTYFSKNSYFVLVEDMKQELATIAALEYPIKKDRDGKERGTWPILHCHPLARGPFMEYDEKEERRRQKAEKAEKEREHERERRRARLREEEKRQAQIHARHQGDLRRSVSLNNLQRRISLPLPPRPGGLVDLDADFDNDKAGSADASGFLGSGAYMAASGNSVGITSAAGTTSTTSTRIHTLQLPPNLRGRLQQQVVTSRRFSTATIPRNGKENVMGPPAAIPDHSNRLLRKSKSTNTLKLPKREEGTKPGYCESCRQKFEDFKAHVTGRRHRRFATDDGNFVALDCVLARVKRRTVQETEAVRRSWRPPAVEEPNPDEDTVMTLPPRDDLADDLNWDDWVDAKGGNEVGGQ